METRIGLAIDALYDAWTTAFNSSAVKVWDGPVLSGDYADAVYVGYDADPEGDAQAGTSDQEWAGVGATRKRNEGLDITCAAVVLVGASDARWKTARDAATGLIETCGVALRSNPSLGQPPPFRAELIPGDYFQENSGVGYQARFVFTVHIETRV